MLFLDDAEAAGYVEGQLKSVRLPPGWRSIRVDLDRLEWEIAPAEMERAPQRDYRLHLSGCRRLLIIYFGNTDAGAFSLHHVALNARVVSAGSLDRFPLSQILSHVIAHDPPNRWGLS